MLCPVCGVETWRTSGSCSSCGADLVLSSSPTAAVEPVAEVDIHFAPGASFGERYTIVERIGVGGEIPKSMHMRVESSCLSKCLHHRDHARAEGVVLESGGYHQLFYRLIGGPR